MLEYNCFPCTIIKVLRSFNGQGEAPFPCTGFILTQAIPKVGSRIYRSMHLQVIYFLKYNANSLESLSLIVKIKGYPWRYTRLNTSYLEIQNLRGGASARPHHTGGTYVALPVPLTVTEEARTLSTGMNMLIRPLPLTLCSQNSGSAAELKTGCLRQSWSTRFKAGQLQSGSQKVSSLTCI